MSLQNESDVFKWVIRKEFQELHRYIDEEKASFLESTEIKAARLIASIESHVKQTSETLKKLKEVEISLEKLNNESQLDFIRVSLPVKGIYSKTLKREQPPQLTGTFPLSMLLGKQSVELLPWSFPGSGNPGTLPGIPLIEERARYLTPAPMKKIEPQSSPQFSPPRQQQEKMELGSPMYPGKESGELGTLPRLPRA